MDGQEFLDIHKKSMDLLGFWDETYTDTIKRFIESKYHPEIIRVWGISDIVINGDKTLLKWHKRMTPLTDEQLTEKWGFEL